MNRAIIIVLLLTALSSLSVSAINNTGEQASNAAAVGAVSDALSCRRFTTADGLPQMQTEALWQDARGYIWVGTLSGFARYDGVSLMPYLRGKRENIVGFAPAGPDGVTALGFVRTWSVSGESATSSLIAPQREWLLNNFNAMDLPAGTLLLEDREETHRHLARITSRGIEHGRANAVLDLMEPDRKMYITGDSTFVPTSRGLYLMDHKGDTFLLSDKQDIYSLMRYRGELLALAGDGIYSVNAGKPTIRTAFEFEAPDYGLMARQRSDGTAFIADAHTIYHYDGCEVKPLTGGYNLIRAIMVDRWDRLWAATYQGLYLFYDTEFVNHRLTDTDDVTRALAVDGEGRVVMGTLNGNIITGSGEVISTGGYFAPGGVALGKSVYMVGGADLTAIDGNGARTAWTADERLRFVTAVDDHHLVVGSRQRLLLLDPSSAAVDTLGTDVYQPWCAAADAAGNLWAGGSRGLYRISLNAPHRTEQVISGDHAIITTMSRDAHGRVYYATVDSVFVITGGNIRHLKALQPVLSGHEVRSMHVSPRGYIVVATLNALIVARLNDNGEPTGKVGRFDHTNGFTIVEPQNAPMAEQPDGTIWLAGLEEMTSFRPDRLMALNEADTIIVGPTPWWRRWWALTLAIAALAAVVWIVARRIERRRTRSQLEQLHREAKLRELQINSIRLKAIPHFHSNVLAGIEYFLMNNDNDNAMHYLQVYNEFANRTLTDIDLPARTVDDELEYARNYLELERLRFDDRLDYSITVDEGVDRQALLPTMVVYTYCQNAVKHGINGKSAGGRVEITITQRDNRVIASVSDNGIGRAAAARAGTAGGRQGLRILHEQIELYNQANERHIVETVTDLTDEQGHAAGTRFEISVPLGFSFNR